MAGHNFVEVSTINKNVKYKQWAILCRGFSNKTESFGAEQCLSNSFMQSVHWRPQLCVGFSKINGKP